ncbi:MAG: DNA adenine methylase [Anaeromyxobacteraceae bacterium]
MIKYIGSKRTLVPLIVDAVKRTGDVRSVADLFSGTSRVGHALKSAGLRVLANDHNAYAATLARCYVQADAEDRIEEATRLVRELNALPGRAGYFTETFCVQSRFFQPRNGERVDAIRDRIAALALDPELEAILLVSLMEAADRVDSTTGVQMAYLKKWAPRAFNDLALRVPALLPRSGFGKGSATCLDAAEAAERLDADLVYVDPPYNQHSYLSNYHVWETLVAWDRPSHYGIACKRVDCRERKSAFNSRPGIRPAMERLLGAIRAPTILVSFSNEGYVKRPEMEEMLRGLWGGKRFLATIENDYKRYVGAQIGIYNPQGEKVGRVSHLRNKEYLYVVSDVDLGERLAPLLGPHSGPRGRVASAG